MRTQNTAPKHRRPRGSGSCKQRAEDDLWVARAYVGEGSSRRRLVAYGRTADLAQLGLDAKKTAAASGRPQTPAGLTVGVQLAQWLESLPPETRPSSLKLYRYLAGLAARELGSTPVKTLTPSDVNRMIARLGPRPGHRGLKPQTRAKVKTILSQALKLAEIDYQIPNAARNATAITLPIPEKTTRSETQIAAILGALDGFVARLAICSVSTGARQNELLGIRVRDIDFTSDPPLWRIDHQLGRVDGRYQLAPTKSVSSRRTLELQPDAVNALREEIEVQRELRAAAGSKWAAPIPVNPEHPEIGDGSDLIFTVSEPGTAQLGTPRSGESLVHLFQRALAKAGLPAQTWHSLRAVLANRLGAQGVPVEVVSAILGHSSIAVTLRSYSTVSPARKGEAMALLPRLQLAPTAADIPTAEEGAP